MLEENAVLLYCPLLAKSHTASIANSLTSVQNGQVVGFAIVACSARAQLHERLYSQITELQLLAVTAFFNIDFSALKKGHYQQKVKLHISLELSIKA